MFKNRRKMVKNSKELINTQLSIIVNFKKERKEIWDRDLEGSEKPGLVAYTCNCCIWKS